jgi:hypothetical protein
MSSVTAIVLTTASVLATTASTGIAMYSADQQSKSQAAIADYNRQINEQNASWQRMAAERAAQAEQFNSQLAMFNAQSAGDQANMNNILVQQQAQQLRAQADGVDNQARQQADNIRAEKARILGLQRSQYAAGGVTPEGSPLAVLADTANLYEMQVADTKLLANLEGNKKRYEADMNSIVGDFNMNADLFSSAMAKKSAAISFNDAQFAEKAGGAGYRIAMRQAAIEQQAGYATSRATQLGGYSAAASGVAQMGQIGMSAYGNSKSKNPTGTVTGYGGQQYVPKTSATGGQYYAPLSGSFKPVS